MRDEIERPDAPFCPFNRVRHPLYAIGRMAIVRKHLRRKLRRAH